MLKLWLTALEIAEARLPGLPNTKMGVFKLAERANWRSDPRLWRERSGAGGGIEWHIDLLPMNARLCYAQRFVKTDKTATQTRLELTGTPTGDAQLALLRAAQRCTRENNLSQQGGDELFCALYNDGKTEMSNGVRSAVKTLSPRTLRRWREAQKYGDVTAWSPASRNSTGVLERAEDGRIKTAILALVIKNPHLSAKHIRAFIVDRFGDELVVDHGEIVATPPLRTFQHVLKQWKSDLKNELLFLSNPDAYKSKVRFSASGSTRAARLNQVWQIDASPADIMTTEGRRSLYVSVDVFSRRVLVLITQTPRADAVALLLRRCLFEWGVPEVIVSDQGSDFTARATRRVFETLGIEHEVCAAFAPEQKGIVERAVGTLQRDLMPTLPGFIGHSVSDRKVIESRKSFAARLGEKDDSLFGVELSTKDLQEACDHWAQQIYAHNPHSGLKGATPFEQAASYTGVVRRIEEEATLDILLAPVAGKDGIRTVTKQGIRLKGEHYLIGSVMPGEEVFCRHDPVDAGVLHVFDVEGETFLGRAVCPELSGVDPKALIAKVKAEQKARMQDGVADIRKAARSIKPRDVAAALRRQADKTNGTLIAFPQPTTPHTNSKISAATRATDAITPAPLDAKTAARHEELKVEPTNITPLRTEETPEQRFQRACDLEDRLDQGCAVDPDQAFWLGGYQNGAEYRAMRKVYEDFGKLKAR